MVKSVIGFALACGAFSMDTTCDDDVVSALQQSALQHSSKNKQVRAHTDVYDRLADVLKQASSGASQICLSVLEGDEAPVAGVFSSDHGVMDVERGYVAESSGRFCADAAVVSLLQRSMGAETMGGMERALSLKGVDGTAKGKGKPSPSPSPTPVAPSPTPVAPSPTPGAADYGVLAKCSNPYIGIHCGGVNRYGCSKAKIVELCDSLDNACCDDEDGSCADGDDNVKCIKNPHAGMGGHGGGGAVEAPPYGSLAMCQQGQPLVDFGGQTYFCSGTRQYGCNAKDIKAQCGGLAKACCSDADGSCEDGDDRVSCLA